MQLIFQAEGSNLESLTKNAEDVAAQFWGWRKQVPNPAYKEGGSEPQFLPNPVVAPFLVTLGDVVATASPRYGGQWLSTVVAVPNVEGKAEQAVRDAVAGLED